MAQMQYTKKQVNDLFKIKVYGKNADGKKLNTLVGVSGLVKLVGIGLFNKLVTRAKKAMYKADKVICKLRRGLKVTFYVW
jgi:hypothetical protein